MEHVKLIAKPNYYYDENTEVFNYDGERYTVRKWEQCEKEDSDILVRGLKNGKWDGELSLREEFEVEKNVKYKKIGESQ